MGPVIIRHSLYENAVAACSAALARARPGALVWLIGPSGVGKSEVRYEVMRRVSGLPIGWGVGRIPAIAVRAARTDRNKFNPKDLAMRLAHGLREPDFSWLTARSEVSSPDVAHLHAEVRLAGNRWALIRASTTEHALRNEFEQHAKLRSLKWVFIEEVHSLLSVHARQAASNYMTSLMQMAEEAGLVLVLIGTHEAENLWLNNEEVRNRSNWVWFRRYKWGQQDMRLFAALVKALGRRYPLTSRDLLIKHLDLMMLNCAGLIGTLERYLDRCELIRQEHGVLEITIKHLEAASRKKSELEQLWDTVHAFDQLSETPVGREDLMGYVNRPRAR